MESQFATKNLLIEIYKKIKKKNKAFSRLGTISEQSHPNKK